MVSRQARMQQAQSALRVGRADRAAALCKDLLAENARDHDVRYLHATCLASLGRLSEAVGEYARVVSQHEHFGPAWINGGIALALSGDPAGALRWLERARAIDSRPAELYFAMGLCRDRLGEPGAAVTLFTEAIKRKPDFPDALNNLGSLHDRLGDLTSAIDCFERAAALHPNFALARQNLGNALLRAGRPIEAANTYRLLTELRPRDALAHADLGTALLAAADYAGATAALETALALDSRLASAAANLGEALRNSNELDRARTSFERAAELQPDLTEAHLGLGRIAVARGDPVRAIPSLVRAARGRPGDANIVLPVVEALLKAGAQSEAALILRAAVGASPGSPELLDALGRSLHRAGSLEEALRCYERALELEPARAETHVNRGRVLESLGRLSEAIESAGLTLRLQSPHGGALALLISCGLRACDWRLVSSAMTDLLGLPAGIDHLHPFVLLALDIDPADQADSLRRRAEGSAATLAAQAAPRSARPTLRVAYLSPDLREHAVGHAIAGVIRHHDRRYIECIGISTTAPDGSEIGRRLREQFDHFIDASALNDVQIAAMLRERGIDIAVDLAGHTVGARPELFAMRMAPVQVSYLGFPGSTGLNFMDFIVADEVVVPPGQEGLYSEQVRRMPHSYLPFDRSRCAKFANATRASAGLPSQGAVFCAFSTSYKISDKVFDTWMALLLDVPGGVLWLRMLDEPARANLRTAATVRGVDPERLIFAPFEADVEAHFSRLALADVFLDTLPYNAHTTAIEALWAGVPVISCPGDKFAGRVGASVLQAAGLPELICPDLAAYRSLAKAFAESVEKRQSMRERLAQLRDTAPIFDTPAYTQAFETLLFKMFDEGRASGHA